MYSTWICTEKKLQYDNRYAAQLDMHRKKQVQKDDRYAVHS